MAAALIELATEQLTTTSNTGTSTVTRSTAIIDDDTTGTPKVTSQTPVPSRQRGRAA